MYAEALRLLNDGLPFGNCRVAADVMDVYVTKKLKVRIMDFNPVGGTTQPLLFRWDELPYHNIMDGVDNKPSEEGKPASVQHSPSCSASGKDRHIRFACNLLSAPA